MCNFVDIDFSSIGKVDYVLHEAAISDPSYPDSEKIFKINYFDAAKLIEKCVDAKIPIIYASSSAAYGDSKPPNTEFASESPLNAYGKSKLELDKFAAEKIKTSKSQILGLRYFNVYGPGEEHKKIGKSVIRNFIDFIIKDKNPVVYGDGSQKRDFVYIYDVIDANIIGMEKKASGIINIGSGNAASFNKIIGIISKKTGKSCTPLYTPIPNPKTYQMETQADMNKAKSILGFVPKFDIESGISDYLEKINNS